MQPGQAWRPQLEDALKMSTAFAVYIGEIGIVNWVELEVSVALEYVVERENYPFIPLLNAGKESYSSLPGFVRQYQGFDNINQNPDQLAHLINICIGKDKPDDVQLLGQNESPFIGLSAFSIEQSHLYFGRKNEITELLNALRKHSILMVTGDSGSGKSSLIKAGVIPAFLGGALLPENFDILENKQSWHVLETRPGQNAFERLADRLGDFADDLGQIHENIKSYKKSVRSRNPEEIYDAIRSALPKNANLLLFVDQFEELFTLCGEKSRGLFIQVISYLSQRNEHEDIFIKIVLTMRHDYYNLSSDYSDFFEGVNNHRYVVNRIANNGIKECIQQPLKLAGIPESESDSFADIILQDLGDKASELALLQIALTQSWQKRKAFNNNLIQAYLSIGGVSGALANLAEKTWESLTDQEKEITPALFVRLTHLNDTGGFTRRLIERNELDNMSYQLAQKLASALNHKGQIKTSESNGEMLGRLLTFNENKKSDFNNGDTENCHRTFELTHEALITQWSRCQQWIQGASKNNKKRVHGLLIQRSKKWVYDSKPENQLLSGFDLEEIKKADLDNKTNHNYFLLSELEKEYLQSSVTKEIKSNRSHRLWKIKVVILVFVVISGLIYYAFAQRNNLKEQVKLSVKAISALSTSEKYADAMTIIEGMKKESKNSSTVKYLKRKIEIFGQTPSANKFVTNNKAMNVVQISPDEKWLAVGEVSGNILIYDLESENKQEPIYLLNKEDAHKKNVIDIAFHPQGKWFVTAGYDRKIIFWSMPKTTSKPEPIGVINTQTKEYNGVTIRALSIHPKEDILAGGGYFASERLGKGGRLYTWDVSDRSKFTSLHPETDVVSKYPISEAGISYSLVGNKLGVMTISEKDNQQYISYLQTDNGNLVKKSDRNKVIKSRGWQYALPDDSYAVATSSDGNYSAISSGNTAIVIDIHDGQHAIVANFAGHRDTITSLDFIQNTEKRLLLITSSFDQTLRIWDVNSGQTLRVLEGHKSAVSLGRFAYAKGRNKIFSVGSDGKLLEWDISFPHQKIIEIKKGNPRNPYSFTISSRNQYQKKQNKMIDRIIENYSYAFQEGLSNIKLAYHPKIKLLAISRYYPETGVREVELLKEEPQGKVVFDKLTHDIPPITDIEYSPDGKILVVASSNGYLYFFGTDTYKKHIGTSVKVPGCKSKKLEKLSIAYGNSDLFVSTDSCIYRWKTNSDNLPQKDSKPTVFDTEHSAIQDIAISKDKKFLTVAGNFQYINIYPLNKNGIENVKDSNNQPMVGAHIRNIHRAHFSDDGKLLATLGNDGIVQVWDSEKKSPLFHIRLPTDYVKNSAYHEFAFPCTDKGCYIIIPMRYVNKGKGNIIAIYDFSNLE